MIKKEAAKLEAKLKKGEKSRKKKEALVGTCYTMEPKVREAEYIARSVIYGREEAPGVERTEDDAES